MPSKAIGQQIANDPRVVELARSRARGNLPGIVTGTELRRLGYQVEPDVKYTTNLNPRNPQHPTPGVFEETNKNDRIIWAAAATVAGVGAGLALAGGAAGPALSQSHNAITVPGATTAGGGGGASGAGLGRLLLGGAFQYGIPAATQLIGARMASNADRDASRLEYDYLNRALEAEREERDYRRRFDEDERSYTRGERANYLTRLSPYSAAGTEAVGRASALMRGGSGGVRMVAPDGSESTVPANQVEHFLAKGARRV